MVSQIDLKKKGNHLGFKFKKRKRVRVRGTKRDEASGGDCGIEQDVEVGCGSGGYTFLS